MQSLDHNEARIFPLEISMDGARLVDGIGVQQATNWHRSILNSNLSNTLKVSEISHKNILASSMICK